MILRHDRGGGNNPAGPDVTKPSSPEPHGPLRPPSQHGKPSSWRCPVETEPTILTIRVDESLYFANARYLEDYILDRAARCQTFGTSSCSAPRSTTST